MPESASPSRAELGPRDRLRLRVVKIWLALMPIAILVVGNRHSAFPIVDWPMYSKTPMPFPENTKSHFEIRVTLRDGRQLILDDNSFLPFGRDLVIGSVIEMAFTAPDPAVRERFKDSLTSMIDRRVGGGVVRSEVWDISWHVDPRATPPLDHSAPAEEVLLGTIEPVAARHGAKSE